MKKWTKEQLAAAAALAQELQAQADPQRTVEENMQAALLRRVDDIDAQQTVTELCSGIRSFHTTLKRTQEQGLPAVVDQTLEAILANRTQEEQAQVLHELLAAFSPVQDLAQGDPAQVDVMKRQLREYLCQYGVLDLGSEGAEVLMRELGRQDLEALSQAQDRASQEQYTALAFYLQKLQGELDAVPDELSAQEIGALTAAAYGTNHTILEGLLGKIDWETVKHRLMMIAGAGLLTLMTIAVAKVVLFTGTLTFWIVKGVVGMSVIGTIVAAFFGFSVVSDILSTAVEIGQSLARATHLDEGVRAGASVLHKWLQETVRPKAAEFWQAVKEFFGVAERQSAQTGAEEQSEQEEADYSPA